MRRQSHCRSVSGGSGLIGDSTSSAREPPRAFSTLGPVRLGSTGVRGVVACLLVWASAATPTAAPLDATAPDAWPQGAPTEAAVTLNKGNEERLVLADLIKGTYEKLGPAGAAEPVWSPDGVWLA